jgi:hypothetical protein
MKGQPNLQPPANLVPNYNAQKARFNKEAANVYITEGQQNFVDKNLNKGNAGTQFMSTTETAALNDVGPLSAAGKVIDQSTTAQTAAANKAIGKEALAAEPSTAPPVKGPTPWKNVGTPGQQLKTNNLKGKNQSMSDRLKNTKK